MCPRGRETEIQGQLVPEQAVRELEGVEVLGLQFVAGSCRMFERKSKKKK